MENEPAEVNLPGMPIRGPHVALAVLCEKVLTEADGVLSIIRIVDRMTLTVQGPGPLPANMPKFAVNTTAVLGFKSDFARGSYIVKLKITSPSQRELTTLEVPMLLEGDDRGANVILNISFEADEEGVYWFDVYVLDVPVTRMPLRILYQRLSIAR